MPLRSFVAAILCALATVAAAQTLSRKAGELIVPGRRRA